MQTLAIGSRPLGALSDSSGIADGTGLLESRLDSLQLVARLRFGRPILGFGQWAVVDRDTLIILVDRKNPTIA